MNRETGWVGFEEWLLQALMKRFAEGGPCADILAVLGGWIGKRTRKARPCRVRGRRSGRKPSRWRGVRGGEEHLSRAYQAKGQRQRRPAFAAAGYARGVGGENGGDRENGLRADGPEQEERDPEEHQR